MARSRMFVYVKPAAPQTEAGQAKKDGKAPPEIDLANLPEEPAQKKDARKTRPMAKSGKADREVPKTDLAGMAEPARKDAGGPSHESAPAGGLREHKPADEPNGARERSGATASGPSVAVADSTAVELGKMLEPLRQAREMEAAGVMAPQAAQSEGPRETDEASGSGRTLLPGAVLGVSVEMPVSQTQAPVAVGAGSSDSSAPLASSVLEPLRVLEAALFMASNGMPASELGKLVGIGAVGHVSGLLQQLSAQYEQNGSSLEVVEENPGKWVMRIRASFAPAVRKFAGEAEIPKHALRTLAFVSRHEGITKRELFKRLGGSIYEDVAELLDKGFVQTKPVGRTQSVSTTPKFRQYFQG